MKCWIIRKRKEPFPASTFSLGRKFRFIVNGYAEPMISDGRTNLEEKIIRIIEVLALLSLRS